MKQNTVSLREVKYSLFTSCWTYSKPFSRSLLQVYENWQRR